MITFCGICTEPATRRVVASRDGQLSTNHYCYVHAVEAGVLEAPLGLLAAVAAESGYAVNAFLFVMECLTRSEHITEGDTAPGMSDKLAVARTALGLCAAISQAAVERFQHQTGLVLSHWKLTRGKDIGAILSGLVTSGAMTRAETDLKVLQELSAMEGLLVVRA